MTTETDPEKQYWYNIRTGQVEHGQMSPAIDRAGPFDTAEEAARAPEIMAARSQAWKEDEEREASWGEPPAGGSAP